MAVGTSPPLLNGPVTSGLSGLRNTTQAAPSAEVDATVPENHLDREIEALLSAENKKLRRVATPEFEHRTFGGPNSLARQHRIVADQEALATADLIFNTSTAPFSTVAF